MSNQLSLVACPCDMGLSKRRERERERENAAQRQRQQQEWLVPPLHNCSSRQLLPQLPGGSPLSGLHLATPLLGISHLFIEGNTPASFGHPFWFFVCDWRMVALMLLGRMDAEVQRIQEFQQRE
ncbi:hypothetical protein L7F22_013239 [Adiantum nelumboides]|nr:hypothetical protein [Adiantum nelumboides]